MSVGVDTTITLPPARVSEILTLEPSALNLSPAAFVTPGIVKSVAMSFNRASNEALSNFAFSIVEIRPSAISLAPSLVLPSAFSIKLVAALKLAKISDLVVTFFSVVLMSLETPDLIFSLSLLPLSSPALVIKASARSSKRLTLLNKPPNQPLIVSNSLLICATKAFHQVFKVSTTPSKVTRVASKRLRSEPTFSKEAAACLCKPKGRIAARMATW